MTDDDVKLACIGLPSMLRGKEEVMAFLKLREEFVNTWTKGGTDKIPPMPSFRTGGGLTFSTPMVMRWLMSYFAGPPEKARREFRPGKDDIEALKRAIIT